MISPSRLQIIFGVAVIVAAGAVIAGIGYDIDLSGSAPSGQTGVPQPAPVAAVHTAGWYVAHPDIAKQDDARCGDDAATISPAACQNVELAEEKMLADEMRNAVLSNSASVKPNAIQAP